MKEKIKTISKYVMNIMAFVNAVLIALSPVWGWNLGKVTDTLGILVGLIGAWLVTGKIFGDKEDEIEKEFEREEKISHEVIEEE